MSEPPETKPSLLLIAGPNGSGKSTIAAQLTKLGQLGVFVNADVIAESLAKRKGEMRPTNETQWQAAQAAEEMRWTLVSQRISLVTETVMSDRDRWVGFINEAKAQGYRTTLYFITTRDPLINVARVADRVLAGGHAVDPRKIVARFHRVMNQVLPIVLELIDEAILFDNSDAETGAIPLLRKESGQITTLLPYPSLPDWAKGILSAIAIRASQQRAQ